MAGGTPASIADANNTQQSLHSEKDSIKDGIDIDVEKAGEFDAEPNGAIAEEETVVTDGVEEHEPDANVVTWDSPDDPANPTNWATWYRWTLIFLVSTITFISSLASSMFAPGVGQVMADFHSNNDVLASLVVTIFVLGLAAGPLIFAPLSELYGRLILTHVGNVGFLIFSIACAVASDLNMLIVFRFFLGTFGSISLTNGGGIIADTVKQEERGFALSMFTFGILLGPVVGPVCGGFLAAALGWRWVFWLVTICSGVLTVICIPIWRESYPPILLARKAARLRKETRNQELRSKYDNGLAASAHFKRSIGRAIKMLVYSPIILALSFWMGLMYSYFYLLLTTMTSIFEQTYGWTPQIAGLSYLGLGVGFTLGQVLFGFVGDKILLRMTARNPDGGMKPEYRLPLGLIGACANPLGLFLYGWTAQYAVHWIVPIIGTAFVSFGNCLIFVCRSQSIGSCNC